MKTLIYLLFFILILAIDLKGQTPREAKKLLNHPSIILDSIKYKQTIIDGKWALVFKQDGKFPNKNITKLDRTTALKFSSDSCFFEDLKTGKVTEFGRFEFYDDNYLVLVPNDDEKTYYNIVYLQGAEYLVVELHIVDSKKSDKLRNTNRRLLYSNELFEK